jgi:hypothetical protein
LKRSRDGSTLLRHYSSLVRAVPIAPLLGRPLLVVEGLRSWRNMVPRSWWRHRPFLPVPDAAWLSFRLETGFGSAGDQPQPDDVIEVLSWSAAFRHTSRARHQASQAR